MGRGQTPMFKEKPLGPKKDQQAYRVDQRLIDLHSIKAKLALRQSLSHPTRGRPIDQQALDQCNHDIAKMQCSIAKWPTVDNRANRLTSASAYVHQMNQAVATKFLGKVEQCIQEIGQQAAIKK